MVGGERMDETTSKPAAPITGLRPACHRCGAPLGGKPDGACPECLVPPRWPEHLHGLARAGARSLVASYSRKAWAHRPVRMPRFSPGEVLGAIALLAGVAYVGPILLVFAMVAILVAVIHRAVLPLADVLILVAILGVLIALCLPSPATHGASRNRIRYGVPAPLEPSPRP
jgi:hypothetical protein